MKATRFMLPLGISLLMLGSAAPVRSKVPPSQSSVRNDGQDTTKKKRTPPDPTGYTFYTADAWTERTEADTPPAILTQAPPVYPDEARLNNIAGRLFIGAIVDEHGKVVATKIFRDIGGGCGEAAAEAVRRWTFTPATVAGKPVKVHVTVPVSFKLRENAYDRLQSIFGGH